MTDITSLLAKVEGDELTAAEFVTLIRAVRENQEASAAAAQNLNTAVANINQILKGKAGYAVKVRENLVNKMYLFADEATYQSWAEEPTEDNAPLCYIELPDDSASASYVVKIETNSALTIEGSSRDVSVNIRFTSQYYNPIDQSLSDSGEDASVVIQRQMDGEEGWTTVGSFSSWASVAANTGAYRSLSLKPYLQNGTQTLRFAATGNISGSTTTLLSFTISIAEMSAEFTTDWGSAFVYDSSVASSQTIRIPLRITGNVFKYLYYEVTNSLGTQVASGSIELGTSEYIESDFQNLTFAHPQIQDVCTIRVRLRYSNSSVYTDWISQNFMVSVSGGTDILLCTNNVISSAYNWSSQHLLDYAVYNPNVVTGSVVAFELLDSTETTSWMSNSNGNTENGVIYDFTPYLSIENNNASGRVRLFAAKLRISVQGTLMKTITYSIDNSNDFAPTTGANFVLMPSSRSNNDTDKRVIHNESSVSGEPATIQATWTNVVFENDGWITDDDDVKQLRILAGGNVTIPYESYSNTSQANGLTIEVDFRVRNIANEDNPVLRMGKEVNGKFVGFIMYPKTGYFFKTTGNIEWFQDVEWGEDKRTHIAVNIIPGITIEGRSLNLVRIFINGIINREFTFDSTDRFWDGTSSEGIRIGSASADIDIFGMRIYKERILSSSEIFNDRIAAVSDIDTKLALIEANNIMEGGVIKYDLAKTKYNTLVWKGRYPWKNNQDSANGDLTINIINDPSHSGTINNMSVKGQGSSSKKYLKWNGSWSFNDDSKWIDGNGTERGKYYYLTSKSPKIKKLVGKLNWASSPQAHKMGMCDIVNVLYDEIFDGSNGYEPFGAKELEGYENTKIAVEEKPFLFFVQEDENSDPVFYGNMTWGSAKGDKLTFGYDKDHPLLKDYLMLEGSDQTPILTLCQAPWFEDEVTYSEEDEFYMYNGMGSFDVTLGNMDSVGHFIDAFNQCYQYSTRINYYNGRLEELQADTSVDKSYQYFIVGQTFDNFKVYRYNYPTGEWVNAGITKTNGEYDEVDLTEQLGITLDASSADFDGILATVKAARIAAFRAIAGNYFHINDTLFGMQINKFMAASDNRAKNTYPYYDPVDGLIRFASDDNDTIMRINNQGQKQKPYWVEEHDFDSRDTFNGYFWAASGNAMYNLFEDAYPDELRTMMRKIMTTMSSLGAGYGDNGGVMGFFDRYFFWIQNYFPAVAYNECARLWYEYAKTLREAGLYINDTDPITQSLGDQLQSEIEWVRLRIVYMASYCMHTASLGTTLEFRQQSSATYNLVPAMKIYVFIEIGNTKKFPVGCTRPKRVDAGETVQIVADASDSIQTIIYGIAYMRDLGDLSSVQVSGATSFSGGKRLYRLKLGNETAGSALFQPNSVSSFPANATIIDLRNMSALTSIGSLADCNKLTAFYCSGSGLTSVILPQTNNLNTLVLNSEIQTLTLRNQSNISTFSYTPTSLRTLVTGNCNVIGQSFIESWLDTITENFSSYSLEFDNINFTNFSATNLVKLAQFGHIILKGTISMDANSISGSQMITIREALGSLIDNGDLTLVYRNIISITATPSAFTGSLQTSQLEIVSLTSNPITILFDGESTSEIVSLTNRVNTIVNGQMVVSGTLVGVEVEAVETINITATDGEVTSDAYPIYVRPVVHITGVSLSGGNQYVTEIGTRTISASFLPNGYSDTPNCAWSIPANSLRDTTNYYVEYDATYYYVKAYSDNRIVVRVNRSSTTGTHSTVVLFNELISSHLNVEDFKVQCDVYDGQELRATAMFGYIGHAYFTPYACQTYDKNEPNYNPWWMLFLSQLTQDGTGVLYQISADFFTDHKIVNEDGSVGYYITQAEASLITTTNTNSLGNGRAESSYTDSDGMVCESYSNGILNPRSYYSQSLYCLQYFTNMIFDQNSNLQPSSVSRLSYIAGIASHAAQMAYGESSVYARFKNVSSAIYIANKPFSARDCIIDYSSGIFVLNASSVKFEVTNLYILNTYPVFDIPSSIASKPKVTISIDHIYVPTSAVDAYKESTLFADYVSIIEGYDFDSDPDGIIADRYDQYV